MSYATFRIQNCNPNEYDTGYQFWISQSSIETHSHHERYYAILQIYNIDMMQYYKFITYVLLHYFILLPCLRNDLFLAIMAHSPTVSVMFFLSFDAVPTTKYHVSMLFLPNFSALQTMSKCHVLQPLQKKYLKNYLHIQRECHLVYQYLCSQIYDVIDFFQNFNSSFK